MANLNKVMLIGRLTRDPEVRMFANGGKVAKFGYAVNNKRKNPQTSQWEDEPVFLDVEAFNRGETGKQADLVEQYLRKGSQVFIEGHLQLDQWKAQDGTNRSKLKIVVDNFQFLEPRQDGGGGGGGMSGGAPRSGGAPPRRQAPAQSHDDYDHRPEPESDAPVPPPAGARPGGDEDIPF
jgi:single-strand DNA-binding protein